MAETERTFVLTNKIALVTGGASGIGEATCRRLTEAGASVIVADRNSASAERVAQELPRGRALTMDVTEPENVRRGFASISHLDILVNSAGVGHVGTIEETNLSDFLHIMDVNVTGVFLVTLSALPLILASHGSIVNIGSVAGIVGIRRRFAYCASKAAVQAMTRQVAVDYPRRLRINCIAPGTVQTPFVEKYLDDYHKHEKEAVRKELIERQPVGRLGTPEEIAAMVHYLCSIEAEFIQGSVLTIDGGWSAA